MNNFKFNLGFVLCFLVTSVNAQDLYSKFIDLDNHSLEIVWDLKEYDGKIYAVMGSICSDEISTCGRVARLSKKGALEWQKIYDPFIPSRRSLVVHDDALFVAGRNVYDTRTAYINKYNLSGDSLDSYSYPIPDHWENIVPRGLVQESDYLYLYGQCKIPAIDDIGVGFIYKIDLEGNFLDSLILTHGDRWNVVSDASPDVNGNIQFSIEYIFEYFPGGGSTFLGFKKGVVTLDDAFEIVKEFHGPQLVGPPFYGNPIAATPDGGNILIGEHEDFSYPEIWKIDNEGNFEWRYEFFSPGESFPEVSDLSLTDDGGVIVVGSKWDTNYFPLTGPKVDLPYMAKISADGDLEWERLFTYEYDLEVDDAENGYFFRVITLNDDRIFTGGRGDQYYLDEQGELRLDLDMWIAMTDENGCIVQQCDYLQEIATSVIEISATESIVVYPNPTEGILNIDVPESLDLKRVEVYAAFGELILQKDDGFNQVDASALASGAYFLRMQGVEGMIYTAKFIKE